MKKLGQRYYSPSLCRWISRDPIEEAGGNNLQGFVGNDPVGKHDPLGLSCWRYFTDVASGRGYAQKDVSSSAEVGVQETFKAGSNELGQFQGHVVMPTDEKHKCKINVRLIIWIQKDLPKRPSKGANYYYLEHVGNDGGHMRASPGVKVTRAAVIAHERGHGDAFFQGQTKCFEAATKAYCGREHTEEEIAQLKTILADCRKKVAEASATYANLATRVHYLKKGYTLIFSNPPDTASDEYEKRYTDKWTYDK